MQENLGNTLSTGYKADLMMLRGNMNGDQIKIFMNAFSPFYFDVEEADDSD